MKHHKNLPEIDFFDGGNGLLSKLADKKLDELVEG
jgi:hypothetical protein